MNSVMSIRPPLIVLLALTLLGELNCGLARHDPVSDSPIPHDIHEARPLPTPAANDVRGLAIASDGAVWAATRGGVFRTSPETDHWQAVAVDPGLSPAFAIAADPTGAVWVGTWSGLHRLTPSGVEQVAEVEGPIAVVAARAGTVVAAGPEGFFIRREDEFERFEPNCTRYLNRAAMAEDGSAWFATAMGLFHWRGGEGSYVRFEADRVSAEVRGMEFGEPGEIWAATLGGVQVYRVGKFKRIIDADAGLPSNDVRCVARAEDGRWWVGTANGVARWEGGRWAVRHSRRWLLHDEVRDIKFHPDGSACIATAGGVSVLREEKLTLEAKAEHFQRILEARHVRPPGIVEKCRLREPGNLSSWTPMDDDNDGGYTAVYLAMESYRYAATGDPAALENARAAFAVLELLQRITETSGFVARTVVPADWQSMHDPNQVLTEAQWATQRVGDPRHKRVPVRWRLSKDGRWLWKGDTSSDEIVAHFFGYYTFYELAASEADRERVRRQVCRVADYLIEGGFVLRDQDGKHTRWGVWAPERLNDDPDWAAERGINSVELLSFLKLAHHVSGQEDYDRHYKDLIERHHYDRNVLEAPNLNPAWRTHIDSELLAFAYPALLALERDPKLARVYRSSFERWHRSIKPDQTPFFEFLYAAYGKPGRADLAGALAVLRDTPLDLIRWTVDNSRREDLRLTRVPEVESLQTDRLLPPSEIGYSRTDQNPWRARQGDGGNSESDGVFWLLPYWMGRYHGSLPGPR